jgi:hypothetical protein
MNPRTERARVLAVAARYQTAAPVDVLGIAHDLGIKVWKSDYDNNISGVLRPSENLGGTSGYAILVNKSHPKNRQRFTVAHEIGHFALHRFDHDGEIKDDEFYRALPGPLEREANEFAADLLMPWGLVADLQKAGTREFEELAKKLEVSKQALAIRLGLPYDQSWD